MDFLADECCDRGLVERLRQSGHDVVYVFESRRGAADDDILAMAFDQRRILITEDKDFGEQTIPFQVLPLLFFVCPDSCDLYSKSSTE